MIGHYFDFHQPRDLDEAAALLAAFREDASVLGGGTMLVPSMSANLVCPGHVISLGALRLDEIALDDMHLHIGAMTTYAQLLASPLVARQAPLLAAMAAQVTGGASIVNQGTLGGAASYANPSSDAPGCLAALEAEFELRSSQGVRHVAAREFFIDAFCTARRADEFLIGVRVPRDTTLVACEYQKYKASASSWPIVTVACSLHRGEQISVRLAVGAAGRRPAYRRFAIDEQVLLAPDAFIEHAATSAQDLVGEGWSDELADADYRRAVVPGVVKRHLRVLLTGTKT
ncbi:Carbon monoxide dehydrogenase medium chain [Paraburkholderia graminis C4D1M]|uniref:Molybdopterin dehydrogenase FAD-binding n=1 Tax=Paraburkholderia graminis (strain ATCC 700544 / DSM 17151 / LMG 18924 / NCIMB 13744 / C4D1M) TaxID=396598 RepID=B1FUN8_PARG4|nr:FAD binding domain-containing protein [Paraburkholderia graminis]ALE58913.1 molybdopterin dehydrogenase [Burkholderia sp. HB1]EDT12272.1 molybdopterin dehydrogenase FAD-binding [Paraburkholderia graminis C4D1M]CAB3720639.1 Carbon monoxide dehydrogenase medium chain [Paraburkholderia graminis C4D1M]